jgi:AcrR family transcriptional regulator
MRGRSKTPEKEQQILRAAGKVFAARDFHQVLMDDVAERAGVGKGTLYRYFPNKEDLYFATLFAGLEELKLEIEGLARRGGSLREVLEAISTGLFRYFWPRRPLLRLLYQYENRLRGAQGGAWLVRRRAIANTIAGVFARAAADREIGDVPPRLAAELFLGMVRSTNLYRGEKDDPEALGRRIAGILLDGLRNGRAKKSRR